MAPSPVPFRAARRFVLAGEQVEIGEVIDVSILTAARVRSMELANYGTRVVAEVDHQQVVPEQHDGEAQGSEPDSLPSPDSEPTPPDPELQAHLDALPDPDDDSLIELGPEVAVAAPPKREKAKPSPRKTTTAAKKRRARASASAPVGD